MLRRVPAAWRSVLLIPALQRRAAAGGVDPCTRCNATCAEPMSKCLLGDAAACDARARCVCDCKLKAGGCGAPAAALRACGRRR